MNCNIDIRTSVLLAIRRKSKQQIKVGKEPVKDMNEIITKWDMAKDDKRYVKDPNPKQMRK